MSVRKSIATKYMAFSHLCTSYTYNLRICKIIARSWHCCLFGVSPKKRFFSLIFALSWSSLFCHEVLVDYLAAFTNPTEINWNTTTETHDWLPWTLWKKPLKLKGISLVKTDLKWKRNHMPRVSNLCWQEMLAARNISPPCVHCYCHSPQMVKHVYVRSNFPNMPK